MEILHGTAFLLYTALLAREDGRTRRIPLLLPAAGSLGGLLFLAAGILRGSLSFRNLLLNYAPGLLWGILLCLLAAVTREAVGKGDGICYLSFSFWWDAAFVLSLLMLSLLFLAVAGLVIMKRRGRDRKMSLPLLPFTLTAAVLLLLRELAEGV